MHPTAGQQLASLVVPISDERLIREDHAYYRSWSLDRDTYLEGAIARLTARGVDADLVAVVVARLEPVATDRRAA